MSRVFSASLWVGLYLALVSAPLWLLLAGEIPPGGGPWWDLAMAFGFAGLAVMGVQFALTARLRRATAPFGIDIIYYFHRLAAYIGIALVLAHFAIVQVLHPDAVGVVNPLQAPGYMSAGRLSLILFLVVIVSSVWRKQLGIEYTRWRILHTVAATSAVLLAIWHVIGVGYYTEALWKYRLWIAYSGFWLMLVVYVRVVRPWSMLHRPYRVVEVRPEGGRTTTLVLEPDGHAGMRFSPGQFAWLTLRGSPFSFEEHPFSFSGSAAAQTGCIEFTIKALGDFTEAIAGVRPGERAWLDGPYGVFSVDRYPAAQGFVFVAAGVGIAPIMSMLRTLADRGDPRPMTLIYADGDAEAMIFREELEALQTRLELERVCVLERPPEGWSGARGRITAELIERFVPADRGGFEYFICGPQPVSDIVQRQLCSMGVKGARVHFELFDMV
ncbi:ferredoxin reductase family protein [Rhodocyclaceae bacterium SMB388]